MLRVINSGLPTGLSSSHGMFAVTKAKRPDPGKDRGVSYQNGEAVISGLGFGSIHWLGEGTLAVDIMTRRPLAVNSAMERISIAVHPHTSTALPTGMNWLDRQTGRDGAL